MTKKIVRFFLYVLPSLSILVMFSCYPSGPSSTGETDVVITAYDSQFNFSNILTYALPDTVFELDGTDEVNHNFDALILNEIENNMNAIGYVRENDPLANGADIVIVVSIGRTDRTWAGGVGWWGWWGGWPGWGYWPGYGPGWGIWYPWPVMGTFSAGTLYVEMLDPNNPVDADQLIPSRWAAALNRILSSSIDITEQRITNSIAQMFDQSPYLGR